MKCVLQPILHKTAYTRVVERELVAWMRETIFQPLVLVMEEYDLKVPARLARMVPERDNAEPPSALVMAIQSGQVSYSGGVFTGSFTSEISRELRSYGATFNSYTRTFHLAAEAFPYPIRGVLAESITSIIAAHNAIVAVLRSVEDNLPLAESGLALDVTLPIFTDLNKQLEVSVRGKMEIPFAPSVYEREKLNQELTHNATIDLKNFAAERIPLLRQRVEENLNTGGRADRLALLLEAEFGIAQRKAEFIADQETGLLVSKYRQIRYEQIGVQEYIWSTSQDERVRPDHMALHGRSFSFSDPPITDRATGARNNPGEDYRCRCVAKPIVNLSEA